MNCYDGIGPWGGRVYGYETRYPRHRRERTPDSYPDCDDYSERDRYSESSYNSETDDDREDYLPRADGGIHVDHVSRINIGGRDVIGGDMRYCLRQHDSHHHRRHHRPFYHREPAGRVRHEERGRVHAHGRNGRRRLCGNDQFDLDDAWRDLWRGNNRAREGGAFRRLNNWADNLYNWHNWEDRNDRNEGRGRAMRMLPPAENNRRQWANERERFYDFAR